MPYDANTLVGLTNEYRKSQGLPPVKYNDTLSKAAQSRALDMAKTGSFSHSVATTTPGMQNGWGFMKKAGYDYNYAGENLAVKFDNPKQIVDSWAKSPSHKANLVKKDYTDIGIAVVPGVYKGKKTYYVVQFFGSQKQPTVVQRSSIKPKLL
jgi:uncharacterized protein YkwD